MRVDVQGAATMRQLVPDLISVFLVTPTEEELIERLIDRKSESTEDLNLRVDTARKEMERLVEFDYCVINADNEKDLAIAQVLGIVDAARCRVDQKPIVL
jgi:guanylate kinase